MDIKLEQVTKSKFQRMARTLTKKWDIKVVVAGTRCCTDGNRIFVPGNSDDMQGENAKLLEGCFDHEVWHNVDAQRHNQAGKRNCFQLMQRVCRNHTERMMLNVFDDIRIERDASGEYIGMAQNLRKLNDYHINKYKNTPIKQLEAGGFWKLVGCAIIAKAQGYSVNWPKSVEIAMDRIGEEVAASRTTRWAEDGLALARRVIEKVKDLKDELKQEQQKRKEQQEQQKAKQQEQEQEQDSEDEQQGQSGDSDDNEDEQDDNEEGQGQDGDSEDEQEDNEDEGDEEGEEDDEFDTDDDSEGEGDEDEGDEDEGEEADADAEGSDDDNEDEQDDDSEDADEGSDDQDAEGGEAENNMSDSELDEAVGDLEDTENDTDTDDLNDEANDELEQEAIDDIKSNERYTTHPDVLDRDKWITPDTYAKDDYKRLATEVKKQVHALKAKLGRILRAKAQARKVVDQDEGDLDGAALWRLRTGNDNIFTQTRQGEATNTCVTMLIDLSGSMGRCERENDGAHYARLTAIAMAETLNSLNIPFEILGFCNKGSSYMLNTGNVTYTRMNPYEFVEFKGYNESHKKTQARLVHMDGREGNADGEAVLMAAKRMATRNENRKILLVLSDGQPTSVTNFAVGAQYLKDVVTAISKAGVEVYGIGLGADHVAEYYNADTGSDHVSIHALDTLAKEVIRLLKNKLTKKGKKVA